MFMKKITMDDINFILKQQYTREIECMYSDYNEDELIFRIQLLTKIL